MRKFTFMLLSAALLALSVPARAQQAAKVFRIGYLQVKARLPLRQGPISTPSVGFA